MGTQTHIAHLHWPRIPLAHCSSGQKDLAPVPDPDPYLDGWSGLLRRVRISSTTFRARSSKPGLERTPRTLKGSACGTSEIDTCRLEHLRGELRADQRQI
jgi:hypothetical protein